MHSIFLALAALLAICTAANLACPPLLVKQPGVRCGNVGHATKLLKKSLIVGTHTRNLHDCAGFCLDNTDCHTFAFDTKRVKTCVLYRYDGGRIGWTYSSGDRTKLYNRACFVKPDPCFYLTVDSPGSPYDNGTIAVSEDPASLFYYPTGFSEAGLHNNYFTITDGLLHSLYSAKGVSLMTYTPANPMLNIVEFVHKNESEGLMTATCAIDPTLNVLNFKDSQGNPLQSQICDYTFKGRGYSGWLVASPGVMDPTFCSHEADMKLVVNTVT